MVERQRFGDLIPHLILLVACHPGACPRIFIGPRPALRRGLDIPTREPAARWVPGTSPGMTPWPR